MRKIKLLFVALLVASVAFMMTACGGGDDARKALEGTTWKGYYGGYKGNVVKFKSEGKAVVKEFEHEETNIIKGKSSSAINFSEKELKLSNGCLILVINLIFLFFK